MGIEAHTRQAKAVAVVRAKAPDPPWFLPLHWAVVEVAEAVVEPHGVEAGVVAEDMAEPPLYTTILFPRMSRCK